MAMFKKVLVAEDHESSNFSVQKVIQELQIPDYDGFYYCDDAFAALQISLENNKPHELLITDLSFEDDGTPQRISDGRELIKNCCDLYPELKVIVFSAEHRLGVIDLLFSNLQIDAYVRKARLDSHELRKALEKVYLGETYLSHDLKLPPKSMNTLEFTNYDMTILQFLGEGILQKNIPKKLQEKGIYPNSLSSVEKRINAMKIVLSVGNTEELIAAGRDIGII